jgi:hypothetical protein
VGYLQKTDSLRYKGNAAVQQAAQVLRGDGFTVEPFLPEGLGEALVCGARTVHRRRFHATARYKDREAEMYSIVRGILEMSEIRPSLWMVF